MEKTTIKKSIKAVQEAIEAQREKIAAIKAREEASKKEWASLTDNEKFSYIKTTPAESRIMREWDATAKERIHAENVQKILNNNLTFLHHKKAVSCLVELSKKYDGKKAGPKTVQEFLTELKNMTGVWANFERGFMSSKCDIINWSIAGTYDRGKYIYLKYDHFIIDESNTFRAICEEDIQPSKLYFISDPDKQLEKINKSYSDAVRAREAYNKAVEKYNSLRVDGFEELGKIYR